MNDETAGKRHARQRLDRQLLLKLFAEASIGHKSKEAALPVDRDDEHETPETPGKECPPRNLSNEAVRFWKVQQGQKARRLVHCADLAIVKATFGKKKGQPGFDPRADVNSDGIVNILDLAFVVRQIPAGTACN
ncbi:MAG TPA: dockerin type I domain-containing protein [Candidatus Acidoferrum sp.]